MKTLLVACALAASSAALAEEKAAQVTPEAEQCLECHARPGMDITLQTGELLSLTIDPAKLSAHSRKLACTDCHVDLKGLAGGHPKRPLPSKRAFAISYSDGCQKCHLDQYKETADGVHRAQIGSGKIDAAVCSDCHGAHDITAPGDPRAKISTTCGSCHTKIAAAYVKSVHGQALTAGSEDVPACTDCHMSHAIGDPRTGAWRAKGPELCGTCHTNEKLMKKYGLSTAVLQTYVADFHGTTVKLQQGSGENPVVAVCTDCHGVHDITKVKDPSSPVIKANLLNTCKKCHADAKADFPSSWLSHYQPSLSKAPLVYLVKLLYTVLIPFMIGGLALQIVLHLWRIVVNR
jgi:predicted CXXCH cytochrome family protein